jgi:hypothetical protein
MSRRKVLIDTVEYHGVSSLPNSPCNGNADGSCFIGAATLKEEATHASIVEVGDVMYAI